MSKEVAHSERAHAALAPSAAHRWIPCPGSVARSVGVEETSSVYANEGTAAHELAAHCLNFGWDADRFADWVIDIKAETPAEMFTETMIDVNGITRFTVDEEMVEGVQEYLDHVRSLVTSKEDALYVEEKLDMSHVHPDNWGTGDAGIYQVKAAHLHVVDLKYGKGVAVDAEDNPQLADYAIGFVKRLHNRPIDKVTIWVAQPRAPHKDGPIRKWELHPMELLDFEALLSAAAKETENPNAEIKPGDWCRFCPVGPTCEERRAAAQQAAMLEFDDAGPALRKPDAMSPGELADVLAEAEFIGDWVKAVQVYAHERAMAGQCPPGFKLVPKRAYRYFKEPADVEFELLNEHGYDKKQVYVTPKFKSVAQVEKLMGKKLFKESFGDDKTGEYIIKRSSGLNLVPESDPRPAAKADGIAEFAS